MEKQTVFIKRYPSKGELPKVSGEYDTSIGNVCFENVNNKFFNHKGELTLDPEWFLEEIELPSEEFFIKEVERLTNYSLNKDWRETISIGYLTCAKFLLSKLKGE